MDKTHSPTDLNRRKTGGKAKRKDYSGSRWAGLILLILTILVSLFFSARSDLGDFFSALFSPAKYTIQK